MSPLASFWERIAALYEAGRFAPMIRRYGEDAVHTAIVRVAERIQRDPDSLSDIKNDAGILGWYSRNASYDHYKQWTNRTTEIDVRTPVAGSGVAHTIEARMTLEMAYARIRQMTPRQQQVFGLVICGHDYQEIAEQTGSTRRSIRTMVSQARKQCREATA